MCFTRWASGGLEVREQGEYYQESNFCNTTSGGARLVEAAAEAVPVHAFVKPEPNALPARPHAARSRSRRAVDCPRRCWYSPTPGVSEGGQIDDRLPRVRADGAALHITSEEPHNLCVFIHHTRVFVQSRVTKIISGQACNSIDRIHYRAYIYTHNTDAGAQIPGPSAS